MLFFRVNRPNRDNVEKEKQTLRIHPIIHTKEAVLLIHFQDVGLGFLLLVLLIHFQDVCFIQSFVQQ